MQNGTTSSGKDAHRCIACVCLSMCTCLNVCTCPLIQNGQLRSLQLLLKSGRECKRGIQLHLAVILATSPTLGKLKIDKLKSDCRKRLSFERFTHSYISQKMVVLSLSLTKVLCNEKGNGSHGKCNGKCDRWPWHGRFRLGPCLALRSCQTVAADRPSLKNSNQFTVCLTLASWFYK